MTSLARYLENSWIRPHESSAEEIGALLAIAERDLNQSQTPGLAAEWRFAIAYNAVLQLAVAALAAAGYQAERQNKHTRSLECLAFTIGASGKEIGLLDHARRKRHLNVYDHVGGVSDGEATDMIELASQLRDRVVAWLKNEHPALLR